MSKGHRGCSACHQCLLALLANISNPVQGSRTRVAVAPVQAGSNSVHCLFMEGKQGEDASSTIVSSVRHHRRQRGTKMWEQGRWVSRGSRERAEFEKGQMDTPSLQWCRVCHDEGIYGGWWEVAVLARDGLIWWMGIAVMVIYCWGGMDFREFCVWGFWTACWWVDWPMIR